MIHFPTSTQSHYHKHLLFFPNCNNQSLLSNVNPNLIFFPRNQTLIYPTNLKLLLRSSSIKLSSDSSDFELPPVSEDDNYDSGTMSSSSVESVSSSSDSIIGVDIEIEEIGKNSRRIRSQVGIDASLETIWGILTDYERLADFIPGLAVSKLLEKGESFARLFQIGQQSLAFGLKFDAKGVVECYEKELETLPFGRRRDIDFKMVEGDFQTFEGKWSIEETYTERYKNSTEAEGVEKDFEKTTTLSYVVDVKPKMWLPVRLVEGRLCREVQLNLSCIREEAMKDTVLKTTLPTC
ncbi:hypothetical protein MKW98_003480 [Papaver atlanticum]|uniref:Coenzyme Q-binding protein COQ10 START domain-containing protein n=1 Tax=Papaver atlanticum TaxID=357466 RepID=A0AAD4XUU9_9MAGN|nr:hypothetical protein MKW98_003480 [Papaver atlanticum]